MSELFTTVKSHIRIRPLTVSCSLRQNDNTLYICVFFVLNRMKAISFDGLKNGKHFNKTITTHSNVKWDTCAKIHTQTRMDHIRPNCRQKKTISLFETELGDEERYRSKDKTKSRQNCTKKCEAKSCSYHKNRSDPFILMHWCVVCIVWLNAQCICEQHNTATRKSRYVVVNFLKRKLWIQIGNAIEYVLPFLIPSKRDRNHNSSAIYGENRMDVEYVNESTGEYHNIALKSYARIGIIPKANLIDVSIF